MYLTEFTKQSFSDSSLLHKADLFQRDFTAGSYNSFALELLFFALIIHL